MSAQPETRRTGLWVAATAAVLLLAAAYGATDLYNLDLGLARATGRYIVERGAVPETNVFSAVHADRPFVDDKWLFHVLAYASVDLCGPAFAVALRMAAILMIAWIVLRVAGRAVLGPLVCALALVTASERFAFRPELFTMLFAALFARLLTTRDPPGRRGFLLLCACQALWTNLHGYFVLGPILALCTAVGALLDARLRGEAAAPQVRRLWLVPALVLAGLLNPYGLSLVVSPVEILLDLRANREFYSQAIVEFAPTFGHYPVLPSDLLAYRILLGALALSLVAANRRVRLVELLPVLALLWMSFEIRRNVAPLAVVAAPMIAIWWDRAFDARRTPAFAAPATWILTALCALCLVFLQVTDRLAVRDRLERTSGLGLSRTAWPDAEVDFVLEHLPEDGLFNSFSFGSYLVGRAYPERRVFIDGNTAGYDVRFLREYADFVNARMDPQEYIERYGLRSFLIKPGHPVTAALLQREDAVPLALGRHAVVIALSGRVDESVLSFDLRRRIGHATFEPVRTPDPGRFRARLPTAEWNRARLMRALELPAEAVDAAREAVSIAPGLYESWHELGVSWFQAGRLGEAERALDEALRLAPGAAWVVADRGMVALGRGRAREALDDFARALELEPGNPLFWFRRALAERAAGDAAFAIESARRAVELDPGLGRAHLLLGQVRWETGDRAAAAVHARDALRCALSESEREAARRLLPAGG